jgi:hypothetical protein
MLKSAQLQKRRAYDDTYHWRVGYDLPDQSNWFLLHV